MEKLKKILQNKKAVLIVGLIVIILLFINLYSKLNKNKITQFAPDENQTEYIAPSLPPLTQSAELREAISLQQKADEEYSNWQNTTRTDFPWINELPVHSEKYFVYFDFNTKVFIGKLYPLVSDDVDEIKNEIQNKLTTDLEIPLEQYPIDWKIFPQ